MNAVFDFGAFPPEVNSARMYVGPGSTSMLSAATAWNDLASELRSQAADYASIISNLTADGWRGQASTAMAAAAAPYTAWMNTTAAQAEQTANQAIAAASAYEAAFGMTVPPAVIAANRAQLASLVATNLLGQNGPAIAATEAQYGQMWAQDAAAMYGYAAQSATATKVPSFTTAPQTTAPGALAGQAAATTQATGTSTQVSLSQLTSAVPNTLQGMSSPATSTSSSTSGLSGLESLLSGGSSGNSQLDSFWSTWGPDANFWNTLSSTGTFNPAADRADRDEFKLLGARRVSGKRRAGRGLAAGHGGRPRLGHAWNFRPDRTWRHRLIDVGKPRPIHIHRSTVGAAELVCGGTDSTLARRLGDRRQPVGRSSGGRARRAGRRPGGCRNGRPGRSNDRHRGQPVPRPPADGPVVGGRRITGSPIADHHNIFRRIGERYAHSFYD